MSIEALTRVVSPPTAPFVAYSGPWEPIEAALHTRLPQDYKDFVRLYGCGAFTEILWVCVPVILNRYMQLAFQAQLVGDNLRAIEQPPYPLWPDAGGLLPFGTTGNDDELFWLCHGFPDDWGVIVWGRSTGTYETFDCGLTDFLAGLAVGEMAPACFPKNLRPCDALFRPFSYKDFGEFSLSWRAIYRDCGEFRTPWRVAYGGTPTEWSQFRREG